MGLLTVSEVRSMAVGRQNGTGAVAEGSHLMIHKLKTERGLAWAFETSKHTPSNTFPPTRSHLLTFLKQFH